MTKVDMLGLDRLLALRNNAAVFERLHRHVHSTLGLVPFVGAGLSVECGLPAWSELLSSQAMEIGDDPRINDLLARGLYEEAAEQLASSLGRNRFDEWLWAKLGPDAIRRIAGPVLFIPAITNGPVLTTNFDRVLERTFAEREYAFAEVGKGPQIDAVAAAIHRDERVLIKIHGDIGDASARVLTLSDYYRHYGGPTPSQADDSLPLPRILEQIFTTRTLLFVGCSLRSDRTLLLLQKVREKHGVPPVHAAILEEPEEGTFSARAGILANLNVSPLWYRRGAHQDVAVLLKALSEPIYLGSVGRTRPASVSASDSFAIDFGTTSTLVSRTNDTSRYEPIHWRDLATIPSVIWFQSHLKYGIGTPEMNAATGPGQLIVNFKRQLGTGARFRVGPAEFDPEDLCTLYLRAVLADAESAVQGRIEELLVSAPANFSMKQINELGQAFVRAGVRPRRIAGEPCMAALNLSRPANDAVEDCLVIDLGGGTLDVAVVESSTNVIEVVSVAGDNQLGGCDFDAAIVELVQERMRPREGLAKGWTRDPRFRFAAERAKVELSLKKSSTVLIPGAPAADGTTIDLAIRITRKDFVEAVAPLVRRVDDCIALALARSRRKTPDTILVGGRGCGIWPVREMIRSRFPRSRLVESWKESAVARGLGHQNAILRGHEREMLLLDVKYRSLCLRSASIGTPTADEVRTVSRERQRWPRLEDTIGDYKGFDQGPLPAELSEVIVISASEDTHSRLLPILPANISIPTKTTKVLRVAPCRSPRTMTVFEEDGLSDRTFVEIGYIPLAANDSVRLLAAIIEVDASHTVVLRIVDLHARTVEDYQVNNLFAEPFLPKDAYPNDYRILPRRSLSR